MKMNAISVKGIVSEAKSTGLITLGIIGGNFVLKMDKKGGLIFPLLVAGGGLLGASLVEDDWAKMILLGAGVGGVIKTANVLGAPEAVTTTEGLFGIKIPAGVKTTINKIFPTLGEASDQFQNFNNLKGDAPEITYPELLPIQAVNGLGDVNIENLK